MKELMNCAKAYVKDMDVWDVGLLKFCLCSIGIIIGLGVPKDKRKPILIIAIIVFIITYIPLIAKLFKICSDRK